MPTWGQILNEINIRIQKGEQRAFDNVRQHYLQQLANYTGRNTIVYASKWTSGDAPPNLVSIIDEDIHGFMEAVHGLKGNTLDILLHTGGGSAEATDAIVSYLRQIFSHIRIIIPQAAMSAGTMLACSADEIIMGKHSFIGPIDPQFILQTSVGIQAVPAHAIIEQFEKAQKEINNNPKSLNSWLPMLSQYGPALLVQCKNQIEFGEELVKNWLSCYMLKSKNDNEAATIAEYLSNHGNFKTHAKHLNITLAKKLGLIIRDLESDQILQEHVLSTFHATMLNLNTAAVKIICNHNGNVFIKRMQLQEISKPIKATQSNKQSLLT